ncbi:MAG TPA: hypothetical protein VGP86_14690 [Xanthobacteraceae bacterium]|jgi:hypothetical protein|nr:hypothetical protein [Xanthobacteraceae bacterium]
MTPTSEQVAPPTVRFLDRMEQAELAIVRCAYAKHVPANAGKRWLMPDAYWSSPAERRRL